MTVAVRSALLAAVFAAVGSGAFARSADLGVDWRGLPRVEGVLREDSKTDYGFANFVAFGPAWQVASQDYAARDHHKETVEDPQLGTGLRFTGRLWAGPVGFAIREEFYDVSQGLRARMRVRWSIANLQSGRPLGLRGAYVRFPLSRAEFAGGRAGEITLPEQYDSAADTWPFEGAEELRVESRDGRKALLVKVLRGSAAVADGRRNRQDRFELRIAFPETETAAESSVEFELEGTLGDASDLRAGKVRIAAPAKPVRLAAGEEWVEFPFSNAVLPGSILDFSTLGTIDAPAGRHGFVKARDDGHLCFERSPQSVRFVGGNLCFGANFLTREQCRSVVNDFVRRGWNAVRLHQLDILATKDGWERLWTRLDCPELSPERLDQLDGLVAECKRAGVYVTFGLYTMGSLGSCEGMDGRPLNGDNAAAWVPIHRPAEDCWFRRAKELFEHVNPYTGVAWKDEPAIAFVSLMDEDTLASVWPSAAAKYLAEYAVWAAAKGRPRVDRAGAAKSPDFAEFLAETKSAANRRMIGRLREIGVKCLCTGGDWWDTRQQAYEREALDLVSNHGFADHPQPNYRSLPFHVNQTSGLKGDDPTYLQPLMKAPSRIYGRPYVLTEYGFCVPNRWRAEGGLMTGAYAALQDWDGLCRLAWSHAAGPMFTSAPVRGFDLVSDPLGQLTDRQVVLLFGRGDVAPAKRAFAYAVRRETAFERGLGDMWWNGLFPHAFVHHALVSRIGSFVADGGREPAVPCDRIWDYAGRAAIPEHTGVAESDTGELRLDTRAGDLTVSTPRTAAVCSAAGNGLVAGPLAVSGVTSFCSVSASAMDGVDLVDSRRVLLLHLTEVLNTDMSFRDESRTDVTGWGRLPYLARTGRAEVSLRSSQSDLALYALASDGSRLREVPAEYQGGVYRFTLEVKSGTGPSSPTMIYALSPR